MLFYGVTV